MSFEAIISTLTIIVSLSVSIYFSTRHDRQCNYKLTAKPDLTLPKLTNSLTRPDRPTLQYFLFFQPHIFSSIFLPTRIWHIWFCPTAQANPSQNQKSQISHRTVRTARIFDYLRTAKCNALDNILFSDCFGCLWLPTSLIVAWTRQTHNPTMFPKI